MTRQYQMPDGTQVPGELQEQIAADVRAFDAAQTPAARTSVQVRKIAGDVVRLRGLLADYLGLRREEKQIANRRAVAAEIMALEAMAYTPTQLRETFAGRELIARYGLGRPGYPDPVDLRGDSE